MNEKKEEYKTVYINQYINLLKKLHKKELLNPDGNQYSPEKYCIGEELEKNIYLPNTITYKGRTIMQLRGLSDYELAMLMEQGDVIGYRVKKDYLGYFKVTIYK